MPSDDRKRAPLLAAALGASALVAHASCDGTRIDALALRPTNVDPPSTTPPELPPQHTTTELIQYGVGTPRGEAELRALVTARDAVDDGPFDGMVLNLGVGSMNDGDVDGPSLAPAVDVLRQSAFRRLRSNFQVLRVGGSAFGDDAAWARAARNVDVVAAATRAAGLRGFFFDVQVGPDAWRYDAAGGPFAAAEGAAKERGQQIGRALFAAFPQAHVMLSLAYTAAFVDTCFGDGRLEGQELGLLPAFLDGLVAAQAEARVPARIFDGFLLGYPTVQPEAFRLYYDLVRFDWNAARAHWIPNVVTYRFAYDVATQTLGERVWPSQPEDRCDAATSGRLQRDLGASFGMMIDYDVWNRGPLRASDASPGEDYRSPDAFETLLRTALGTADAYVWLWTSQPFATIPGVTDGLEPVPERYMNALRRARERDAGP